jgi:uncharacterized protein DUF6152
MKIRFNFRFLRLRAVALALRLTAIFVIASAAVPLLAHHSFAAEFDRNKPVNFTGTVTKVEWANPHARFFIAVTGWAAKNINYVGNTQAVTLANGKKVFAGSSAEGEGGQ